MALKVLVSMDTIKAQQIYEEMNICVIQHDSKSIGIYGYH